MLNLSGNKICKAIEEKSGAHVELAAAVLCAPHVKASSCVSEIMLAENAMWWLGIEVERFMLDYKHHIRNGAFSFEVDLGECRESWECSPKVPCARRAVKGSPALPDKFINSHFQ